ncbi:hypothetical protein JMN32_19300 [Fulvivirga sp. 29W222]|uniref:Uncharacterized protein n=1 Tax=Fulvivirga marina TaxID=2494733 RepID=A0A937G0W7_9BACT|nr:hypothetical protein [Fulvivirga marina]MBL6448468.1 hypothetical protein [Fulvivirga marina]
MAEDCSDFHCSKQQGNVNQICKDEGWPEGHKVLVCTDGVCCNCHCSCLEFGTHIAYASDKDKAVELFAVGEPVLATGPDVASWKELVVEFSGGTAGSSNSPFMVAVTYDDGGENKELVVTEDNLFLMPNGKMKRADELVPGKDKLVKASGISDTAEVTEIRRVSVSTGVHHISTGTEKPTTLDGHLLNVQGIVVGDYVVQLFQDELGQFMDDGKIGAFKVGTREYDKEHALTTHTVKKTMALKDLLDKKVLESFDYWNHTLFSIALDPIPTNDPSFLTEDQAKQMSQFAPKASYYDSAIIAEVEYLFTIYHAFYPEVHFILDWSNEKANAYSTTLGDQKVIIVTGGLARIEALKLQGLSIVLAHQLGRIYGGEPERQDGYSCMGQADYYGVRIVMRKVWYDDLYASMVFPGIEQVRESFQYISNGDTDVCISPTLDCRIVTLDAGATKPELPACAGGPSQEYLAVEGAVADNEGEVTITFNQKVNKATAENVEHYVCDPRVRIESATVTGRKGVDVVLKANFESGSDYRVTVSNVLSANGEPTNPNKSSAEFTAK